MEKEIEAVSSSSNGIEISAAEPSKVNCKLYFYVLPPLILIWFLSSLIVLISATLGFEVWGKALCIDGQLLKRAIWLFKQNRMLGNLLKESFLSS